MCYKVMCMLDMNLDNENLINVVFVHATTLSESLLRLCTFLRILSSPNVFSRFYYYSVKVFLISCNVCADAGCTIISLSQQMVINKLRLNIFQFFAYRADPSCCLICVVQFCLFTELLL